MFRIALLLLASAAAFSQPARKIPLIHTTDLYHPPNDPDDHVDLATLFALEEFDVRAVLLDVDRAFTGAAAQDGRPHREPGFIPVAQLGWITGRAVACAAGPETALRSVSDPATDRPRREQAAVALLLKALREIPEPAVVTVLGSARIVTAAFNREPALLRSKVKSVVVNAGSSDDDAAEFNVMLDVHAYTGLFRSGLPVDWYPCAAKGPNASVALNYSEHNSYWKVSHRDLFRNLPQPLLAWFVYGFGGNGRGDILRALSEEGRGAAAGMLMAGNRNMWSTASLVLAAGRVLAKMPDGWRFVPATQLAAGTETELLALDSVSVAAAEDGRTAWKPAPNGSPVRLFRRNPGPQHEAAMAEALNALLRSLD